MSLGPGPIDREPLQEEFVGILRAAWERGAAEYGDVSFYRPLPETLNELQQEAADIAGWGYIVWAQIKRLMDTRLSIADSPNRVAAMEMLITGLVELIESQPIGDAIHSDARLQSLLVDARAVMGIEGMGSQEETLPFDLL